MRPPKSGHHPDPYIAMPAAVSSSLSLHHRLTGAVVAGRYELDRVIGQGGMGLVYLAWRRSDRRRVVIKLLAPHWYEDPTAISRFEREGLRLAQLDHPNVVKLIECGRQGDHGFIVMEYLVGVPLRRYLAKRGRLSLAEFAPIAAQVAAGVGFAHDRNIMVRDIKPGNIMLCTRENKACWVKLLDFGLAKLVDADDEEITKSHVVGTAGYLAPEQIRGDAVDVRVDVYALGVLFYLLLSGASPILGENDGARLYNHVHGTPPPLAEVLPAGHGVPDPLLGLIHRCLAKEPAQRPESANEVAETLFECLDPALFARPEADEVWQREVDEYVNSRDPTPVVDDENAGVPIAVDDRSGSVVPGSSSATNVGSGSAGLEPEPDAPMPRPREQSSGRRTPSGPPRRLPTGRMLPIPLALAQEANSRAINLGGVDPPPAPPKVQRAAPSRPARAAEAADVVDAPRSSDSLVTAVGRPSSSMVAGAGFQVSYPWMLVVGLLALFTGALGAWVVVRGPKPHALPVAPSSVGPSGPSAPTAVHARGQVDPAPAIVAEPIAEEVPLIVPLGTVKLRGPRGAKVEADGAPVGDLPLTLELPVGAHRIRVTAPGRTTWEEDVQLLEGDNPRLRIRMKPIRPSATPRPERVEGQDAAASVPALGDVESPAGEGPSATMTEPRPPPPAPPPPAPPPPPPPEPSPG